ncbi:NADH/ubiquinone/plastoquinone (complex I) [candidate division NPL-UPA2 bacterium]|nr:NADH/ubiquinone/plastoquinone (complex I) [candidate division NPL-UPA2 bacterium]
MNHLLPLFIALPLGCGFISYLALRNRERLVDGLALICLGYLALASLWMIRVLSVQGPHVYLLGGWPSPLGISLVLDGLSLIFLIIVNVLAFLTALYSINYMEQFTAKAKYQIMFLFMVAGMNGVILSGDFFNRYVFLEIASIAAYVLVAFGCKHEELEASFKYMVLGSIGSTFILVGVALIYALTGTLNMAHFAGIIAARGMDRGLMLALTFFLMGFSLKAALVPFHAWLPDAHPAAPATISAMLSGVWIKAMGVYPILRIFFNVFGLTSTLTSIFIALGVVSMVVGVFLAIGQWDYKRLLAYHSISQMGYVLLGIGVGGAVIVAGGPVAIASLGIAGGLLHLINHAAFKSLLFLTSGAVEYAVGTRELKKMGGLSARMPVTGATATIASLSIAGLPPFNGFFSKLLIIIACLQANYYWLAFIAIGVSVMTLASFLKVQKFAFFGKLKKELEKVKEVPRLMCFSMIILAALCLGLGLLIFPPLRGIILDPAVEALIQSQEYARFLTYPFE